MHAHKHTVTCAPAGSVGSRGNYAGAQVQGQAAAAEVLFLCVDVCCVRRAPAGAVYSPRGVGLRMGTLLKSSIAKREFPLPLVCVCVSWEKLTGDIFWPSTPRAPKSDGLTSVSPLDLIMSPNGRANPVC